MIHPASNSNAQPGMIRPADTRPGHLPPAAARSGGDDTLDTSSSTSLREALAALPEVRPEAVEQGRKLAMDPNYPPRAIIENIARLFVESQDPSNHA